MTILSILSDLFRSGHHINIILKQSVEVRHMEIVELGFVREYQKG